MGSCTTKNTTPDTVAAYGPRSDTAVTVPQQRAPGSFAAPTPGEHDGDEVIEEGGVPKAAKEELPERPVAAQVGEMSSVALGDTSYALDCYPYTFSPLLLFVDGSYFDKGHSNYNAVARFFDPVLREEVDMLENVLYDTKNMLYE